MKHVLLSILTIAIIAGCSDDFENSLASFGGNVAGDRGTVDVVFFNHTPNQATFTFGTYDSLDPESQPDFGQFGLGSNDVMLPGGAASDVLALNCGRVLSIGSPKLLGLIEENLPDAPVESEALVEGVEFFSSLSDGQVVEDPQSQGSAPPFEALLGVDFPCNAFLIIYLEIDDLSSNPFRIDFELIPSESDR